MNESGREFGREFGKKHAEFVRRGQEIGKNASKTL
jgi:hypothetical protein